MVMRNLFISIILIFIIISCASAMEFADVEGQWAIYELTEEQPIPGLTRMKISFPSAEKVNDPEMPFFTKGSYLGQALRRLEKGKGAQLFSFEQVKKLTLDSEILIGTSRSFRDDRSGRIYAPRSDWSGLEKDYTYVPLTQEDYLTMMDAGMNIFRVPLDHLPWGYLCDHYQMKHYTSVDSTFTQGRMWWSTRMKLNDDNGHGVRYKDVLAAAVEEAVKLLETDTRFDFIFLRKGEKTEGYQEVRRVIENAEVIIE